MTDTAEFKESSDRRHETKETSASPSLDRISRQNSLLKRRCAPWLLPTVIVLCFICASGCSALINAPAVYGGTRALLDAPFPIEAASVDLGSGSKEANIRALILINAGWVIDFPLTAVVDTVLLPISIAVKAEASSSWWDFWH